PSASSRPPCASGPMHNTGPIPSKETLICNLGPTTTTVNVPMVASTTGRPSAAPIPEQRLDHLQAPAVDFRDRGGPGKVKSRFLPSFGMTSFLIASCIRIAPAERKFPPLRKSSRLRTLDFGRDDSGGVASAIMAGHFSLKESNMKVWITLQKTNT